MSLSDPLVETLAVLPLVALLLGLVAWRGRASRSRPHGRRLPPRRIAAEATLLGLLAVGFLAHRLLPLEDARPVLAAGIFALVLLHAAGQLLALRPLLGRPDAPLRAPSALFFLLPFAVYLALAPWAAGVRQPDGDEPYYLLLAHSIADDLDVDLADEYREGDSLRFMERRLEPQPGDPVGPGGQVYSRHDALLPMLLALPYRLAGRTGALLTMAALAAALAWAFLALARRAFPAHPGEALVAYGVVALTPPLLTYAHQVWVEVPAALAVAVALERALALSEPPCGSPEAVARPRRALLRLWLPLVLAVMALPFLKLRFALVAVPLVLVTWLRADRAGRALHGNRWRSRAMVAAAMVAALAAVMVVNLVRYGNPLKIHAWNELALAHFSPPSYVRGALGLLWDAAFGLFFFSPLWLLVVPGVVALLRAGKGAATRRLAAELAVIALPYLVVTVPRPEWYGGWSPPFRYGVVLLPLLGLLLVPLLTRRRRSGARVLLATLGLATAVVTLVWLAIPGLTYDLADGRSHLLDALSAGLGADAARLFPSYVRPRLASWVWPPASAALALLLWYWPGRTRGRERAAPSLGAASPAVAGALLLAALAALPLVARGAPTGTVELEDPWIDHRGGHLQPETWVVARSQHRQGWVIRPFEEVRVPLVPGGDRVELVLELLVGRNNPDPLTLEVAAGEEVLTVWTPPIGDGRPGGSADGPPAGGATGGGERLVLGPFDWPSGGGAADPSTDRGEDRPPPLVLRAVGAARPGRQNGFLLDRLEVRWR